MRLIHLIIESVFIGITLILGVNAFSSANDTLGFFAWLQVLGAGQVLHSLIIGIIYHKRNDILNWVVFYWGGVILTLLLIFVFLPFSADAINFIIFPTFPLMLAVYFWFITWHFRRRTSQKSKGNNINSRDTAFI